MVDGLLVWSVLGGVLLVVLVATVVQVVPEHQRIVVTRLGRIVRVAGPGVVLRLPAIEEVSTVSLRPQVREILVSATTREGVQVQLVARVTCRITEPSLAMTATADAFEATLDVLESRLHSEITLSDLRSLVGLRAELESELPGAANPVTATWGVRVLELRLLDIEARLSGDLLRGLPVPDDRS